jgi:hypothetical protein
MSNLLPLPRAKHVWAVHRAHFVFVTALVFFALAILGALALLPSYLAVAFAAPGDPSASAQGEAFDASTLTRSQAIVRTLTSSFATTSPSEAIAAALAARTAGTSITHITYTQNTREIAIDGTGTRASISAYRDALSRNPRFGAVSIPVAALVGNEGGNFSITLRDAQ